MTTLFERLSRFKARMVREPLPPEDIAAGWALGMFVGCAVPFGMQLVISIPLALMMRVSKLGATLGTFITNPVTIFFIYPAQTFVVNRILFGGSLTYAKLVETEWTWAAVRRLGAEVMASFFLGGFLLAIVLTPITYFLVKRIVVKSRERRARTDPIAAGREKWYNMCRQNEKGVNAKNKERQNEQSCRNHPENGGGAHLA